jgi:uncharacterized DUF497 family protein
MYRFADGSLAEWDEAKNVDLKRARGVSFEDVVEAMETGLVLADEPHPNSARYPGQRVLVVQIAGYTHVVPYVPGDGRIFLTTIYPSRHAQRRLGGERDGDTKS